MDPDVGPQGAGLGGTIEQWYQRGKLVGGIGSDSLEDLLRNASNYIAVIKALSDASNLSVLDLGSGVGIPGLLIAWQSDDLRVTLLDAMTRRITVARDYIARLGLDSRASVIHGRSEDYATQLTEKYDFVVARCFGPPALVAEMAISFLKPKGALIVSDSPKTSSRSRRWPTRQIRALGYQSPTFHDLDQHFVVLARSGQPLRRLRSYQTMIKMPLWRVSN